MTFQSDVAPLRRVVMKHARDAFVSSERIAAQWAALDYAAPPDLEAACRESDALAHLLRTLGVSVEWVPAGDVGLDSIYVRDAAVLCDRGAVLARMAKPARAWEPARLGLALGALGIPVLGAVQPPGRLEGGDVVWLGPRTLAVGLGKRTDAAGIAQLEALFAGVEVITVTLPDWSAPGDVFHLMSALSPLAEDLALVYRPLLPRGLWDDLRARGYTLVDVPDAELDSMGPNVLAVASRRAIALEGAPETRRRMERAGVEVHTYRGEHISRKGFGGPTCLTRPLEREA